MKVHRILTRNDARPICGQARSPLRTLDNPQDVTCEKCLKLMESRKRQVEPISDENRQRVEQWKAKQWQKARAVTKSAIFTEVLSTFTAQEINDCTTFDEFWLKIEVTNGYEDQWEELKEQFRPIYEEVYIELKAFL